MFAMLSQRATRWGSEAWPRKFVESTPAEVSLRPISSLGGRRAWKTLKHWFFPCFSLASEHKSGERKWPLPCLTVCLFGSNGHKNKILVCARVRFRMKRVDTKLVCGSFCLGGCAFGWTLKQSETRCEMRFVYRLLWSPFCVLSTSCK